MKYIRGAIALGCMFKAQISKNSHGFFNRAAPNMEAAMGRFVH